MGSFTEEHDLDTASGRMGYGGPLQGCSSQRVGGGVGVFLPAAVSYESSILDVYFESPLEELEGFLLSDALSGERSTSAAWVSCESDAHIPPSFFYRAR